MTVVRTIEHGIGGTPTTGSPAGTAPVRDPASADPAVAGHHPTSS